MSVKESTGSLLAPSRLNKSKTRIRALPTIDHNAQREKLNSIIGATDEDVDAVVITKRRGDRNSSQKPYQKSSTVIPDSHQQKQAGAARGSSTNLAAEIIAQSQR